MTNKATEALEAEIADLKNFLRGEGYSMCNIAACNCNSWHGGHAGNRLSEIRHLLEEHDIEWSGTLLKTIRQALQPSQPPSNSEALEGLIRLAQRTLHLAFVWNDHNFEPAHEMAQKSAKHENIKDLEQANDFIEKARAALSRPSVDVDVEALKDECLEIAENRGFLGCPIDHGVDVAIDHLHTHGYLNAHDTHAPEWFFRWIARGKAGYAGHTLEQCVDVIWHSPLNPYIENNPWQLPQADNAESGA